MKTQIIITVLLVLTLGLNAQRTNTDTRSATRTTSTSKKAEDTKKTSPAKTETRKSEPSTTRPVVKTETRQENQVRSTSPERKVAPVTTETRTRETPQVKNTETPGKIETRTISQGNSRPTSNSRQTDQRSGTNVNSRNRETGTRNSTTSRTEVRTQTPGNSRDASVTRSRQYTPRTDPQYVEKRQVYRTPERHRIARTSNQSTTYVHQPVEYRRSYYPYAEPRRVEIIWDVNMYNEYRYLYPHYDYWYYPIGYRIQTVSAYDASRYIGEISRIYGKVSDVFYSTETDEYTLYFGEPYPNQDFSVILSGKQARRYNRHPERYFTNRNIAVTGLISLWEDRPEMIIKKRSQVEIYN
jgi:hypothetical protein